MNGMIYRTVAMSVVLGLALWGPGVPLVLAQVEITPEIREACQQFEPELRDIALNEIVPAIEAEPEGTEAKVVETAAVAIAEATQATQDVLANPEAVVNSTVAALRSNGVPADVATGVQTQLQDALSKASAALNSGGTVADAAKYFEICQKAMADCGGYLGGKDFKEIFAAGGAGFDRPEIGIFCGTVFDPSQRDGFQAAMEASFKSSMEMALRGGTEGLGSSDMRAMMEKMASVGMNPAEMMTHSGGEFHGASPEAMAAMSPEQRTAMEAQFKATETQFREMGAQMETQMKEMGEHPMKEMMEKYAMDPKELATVDEKAFSTFQTATGGGTTRTLTATHDHLPAGFPDGVIDEYHYSDGTASPTPL